MLEVFRRNEGRRSTVPVKKAKQGREHYVHYDEFVELMHMAEEMADWIRGAVSEMKKVGPQLTKLEQEHADLKRSYKQGLALAWDEGKVAGRVFPPRENPYGTVSQGVVLTEEMRKDGI